MASLNGKVVVITGASSGVGEATARLFAKRHAKVVLAARNMDRLKSICKEISESGQQCMAVKVDVTNPDDISKLFEVTQRHFEPADILINSAGRGLKSPILETSYEDWQEVLATNLTGVFLSSRAAADQMVKSGVQGHIITVGSVGGRLAAPSYGAYIAAKHGVTGFQRAIRWELKQWGVKVSTIYPSRINTPFFDRYPKRPRRWQMLSPDDIARYLTAIAMQSTTRIVGIRLWLIVKRMLNFFRYLPFKEPEDANRNVADSPVSEST